MKKVSQSVDDILLDYLDGSLNSVEKKKIEDGLQQNPSWQLRLEELRLVTSVLSQTTIDRPSKNFTNAVMNKLDQYPAQRGFSIRNGIFLLIGVLIAIGIATVLVSSGEFDHTTTSIDLNQVELPKKFINTPLPYFEFSGKLIVNGIIIMNLILAWIVLDRAILKPFFQRRAQAGQ